MKNLLLFLVFLQIHSTSFSATVINIGKEAVHFSYEDKYGEVAGIWIKYNEKFELPVQTNSLMRVVFEFNQKLHPVLISGNDYIEVKRIENNYYFPKNEDFFTIYSELNSKYAIIMSPLFGIDYSKVKDLNLFVNEAKRYKELRSDYLNSSIIQDKELKNGLLLSVQGRFISELIAPYSELGYLNKITNIDHYKFVKREALNFIEFVNHSNNYDLVKQYLWSIEQFLLIQNENHNPSKIIASIITKYSDQRISHYLIWRFYKKNILNSSDKEIYEHFFISECKDKEYAKNIRASSWLK